MSKCCYDKKKRIRRYILYGVGGLVAAVLLVIFLFWAITKPTKPSFTLKDATLNSLNLSSSSVCCQPKLLSASMQITLSSTNRMDNIGIYYEKLEVHATYRSQQITLPTQIPQTYLGHRETSDWSPFLNANPVSVSPDVAQALGEDKNAGAVLLHIKVQGSVKWKVGTFVSGEYRLNVNCQAQIACSEKGDCIAAGAGAMKLGNEKSCFVEV